jgi:hypothetical protein
MLDMALPGYRRHVAEAHVSGYQTSMTGWGGGGNEWEFQFQEIREGAGAPVDDPCLYVLVRKTTPWWDGCGSLSDYRVVALDLQSTPQPGDLPAP